MARINTNVSALIAQQGLAKSQMQENSTLRRLSTGLRINTGADDPAGLIASEGLKSEIAGINAAQSNSSQAINVISTADGALNEVSALLLNIQGLIVQAANTGGMSAAEISANQLQIDSAVSSITRIANTTTFDGLHLIDGSLNYVTSGVQSNQITSLNVTQASFGTHPSVPVNLNVITSARPAELNFATSQIANSVTLQITGTHGTSVLSFLSATHTSAIAFAINRVADSTGVSAAYISATNWQSGITFKSDGFGSKNFVSVVAQKGTFNTTDLTGATKSRDIGRDAVATINGALTVGDGLDLKLNTSGLNLSMTLDKTFGAGATQFAITGGGAKFQLGSQVTTNQQVSIGIGSVSADKLGNYVDGFLSDIVTGGSSSIEAGKNEQASAIIQDAIAQVANLRGQLGAFQKNTLQTNQNSLSIALENVTSSQSSIADADFASETSNLTRAQILTQAGTSVLSTANSQPQAILKLLG